MTLPQVPIPAGVPQPAYGFEPTIGSPALLKLLSVTDPVELERGREAERILFGRKPIPATSIDPSRLKSFEKAVKLAKPMGSK